jgi:hypothetical protein
MGFGIMKIPQHDVVISFCDVRQVSTCRRVHAVSRRLANDRAVPKLKRLVAGFPPRRPGFDPRSGNVGFVLTPPRETKKKKKSSEWSS